MTVRTRLERLEGRGRLAERDISGAPAELERRLDVISTRIGQAAAPENPSFAEILCGAPCTQDRFAEFEAYCRGTYPGALAWFRSYRDAKLGYA